MKRMARKKRATAPRRRRKIKKLPPWAFLVLGLTIGIVLTALVTVFAYRGTSPGSGLGALISRAHKPPDRSNKKTPSAASPAKVRMPKFDFYTILPEIETVLPEAEPLPQRKPAKAPDTNVRYVLQAASFARFEDADRLKARLALNGLVTHIQKVTIEGKGEFYRVRLGPYDNLAELNTANARLRELGIEALRLKVKREG
jgi:cell division septation protein DedD